MTASELIEQSWPSQPDLNGTSRSVGVYASDVNVISGEIQIIYGGPQTNQAISNRMLTLKGGAWSRPPDPWKVRLDMRPQHEPGAGDPRGGQPQPSGLGRLYVISAPSGAGKTSLVKALMEREPRMRFSVSYTTRPPRPNEVDGRDYHFVTRDRFEEMAARGEFLEHARVYDNFYGTSLRTVQSELRDGHLLLLEIDWQGARQVRSRLPAARSIFILPPTRRALEERLRARSTDSEAVIERRFRDAAQDMAHWTEFDYVVFNDQFERAVADLLAIVQLRGDELAATRPEVARFAAELLKS